MSWFWIILGCLGLWWTIHGLYLIGWGLFTGLSHFFFGVPGADLQDMEP